MTDNQQTPRTMHYTEWMKLGIDNGWITTTICYTHDGTPATEKEKQQQVDSK